jgi:hypothetical protein
MVQMQLGYPIAYSRNIELIAPKNGLHILGQCTGLQQQLLTVLRLELIDLGNGRAPRYQNYPGVIGIFT